jgi:hypothetical protein
MRRRVEVVGEGDEKTCGARRVLQPTCVRASALQAAEHHGAAIACARERSDDSHAVL